MLCRDTGLEQMAKKSLMIFLALVWLIAANHCALADAFSLSSSKNNPAHSSCYHHQDDVKIPFPKDHTRCLDNGCCQLALTLKGEVNLGVATLINFNNFIVPLLNIIHKTLIAGELSIKLRDRIHSPPVLIIELLNHSLSLSPNAPPSKFI